jgi:lipoprotein NlpI
MTEQRKDSPTRAPQVRPTSGPAPVPGEVPTKAKPKLHTPEFGSPEDTAVLAPSLAAAFVNCGVDRLHQGQTAAAIADFDHAIKIDPDSGRAWCLRGYAHAMQMDWKKAERDIRRSLHAGLPQSHDDSARLRLWVARARGGAVEAATKELAEHFEKRSTPPVDAWVRRIADFIAERVPEDQFLGALQAQPACNGPDRACETWYFAGARRISRGDRVGAIAAFQNAVATNARDISAWACARAELLALQGGKA